LREEYCPIRLLDHSRYFFVAGTK